MDDKLKPCPFCGNSNIQIDRIGDNRGSAQVFCADCGVMVESNEKGYGDAWNRRPGEDAIRQAALEEACKAVERLRPLDYVYPAKVIYRSKATDIISRLMEQE